MACCGACKGAPLRVGRENYRGPQAGREAGALPPAREKKGSKKKKKHAGKPVSSSLELVPAGWHRRERALLLQHHSSPTYTHVACGCGQTGMAALTDPHLCQGGVDTPPHTFTSTFHTGRDPGPASCYPHAESHRAKAAKTAC